MGVNFIEAATNTPIPCQRCCPTATPIPQPPSRRWGLENLLRHRQSPGRTLLLSKAQLSALRDALAQQSRFSSYPQMQQYIADTFGVKISYKAVYSLVHDKLRAKLKVPRKTHKKMKP